MHKNCIGKFRKCSHVKEEVHCLMDLYSKCLTATIFHVQNYFSLTSTADKRQKIVWKALYINVQKKTKTKVPLLNLTYDIKQTRSNTCISLNGMWNIDNIVE